MSRVYNDLDTLAMQHCQQNYGAAYGMDQCQPAGLLGQCVPYQSYWHYCRCSHPRDLNDFEIVIEQTGTLEPQLNYGAKLRLLMADPLKGHDLREAIAKLKTALKEAYA